MASSSERPIETPPPVPATDEKSQSGESSSLTGEEDSREAEVLLKQVPTQRRYSRRDSCVQYRDGASWHSTGFIMANIIVGIGMLNFPAAYKHAGGLAAAIPIQLVCIVATLMGLLMMIHCSDMARRDTYQDVVEYFCGRIALFICNCFIVIHNLGTCITLLVILADQVDQIFMFGYGPDFCQFWYMRRVFTLPVLTCVLVLPFCFPEKMDAFKFVSVIGVTSTGYIIALSIWKYYSADVTGVVIRTRPNSWVDVFKVVPVICFAFEGHVESVTLYSGFTKRRVSEFAKSATLAYSIALVVYTVVGICGYLTLGERVKTDLLMSYYPIDVTVIIAIATMGLKSLTTYPVIYFCVRIVVDDGCERILKCQPPVWTEFRRRICHTTLLVILSLLVALFVPNIGSIISLLGGSAALFLFVFPGLCFMHAHKKHAFKYGYRAAMGKVGLGVFTVALGSFLATTTTIQSIARFKMGELSAPEIDCTW